MASQGLKILVVDCVEKEALPWRGDEDEDGDEEN